MEFQNKIKELISKPFLSITEIIDIDNEECTSSKIHRIGHHSGTSPEKIVKSINHNNLTHVIDENDPQIKEQLELASNLVFIKKEIARNPLIFFLEFWGKSTKERDFLHLVYDPYANKELLLDELMDYVKKLTAKESNLNKIRIILDELVTNTLMHVPENEIKHKFRKAENLNEVIKSKKEDIHILLFATDKTVHIISVDQNGMIKIKDIFARLEEIYTKGISDSISWETKGARIGFRMILEYCRDLSIIVEKKSRSIVYASVDIASKSTSLRNIHLREVDSYLEKEKKQKESFISKVNDKNEQRKSGLKLENPKKRK